MKIPFVALDSALEPPRVAHPGDAGVDLRAATTLSLGPGERAVVPTGVAVGLPEGHAGLVVPRSGLAARHGITVLNAPGLIDAGYRGEVKVILVNLGQETVEVARGERIAQLVVVPVATPEPVRVEVLDETVRGAGGLGSTGR